MCANNCIGNVGALNRKCYNVNYLWSLLCYFHGLKGKQKRLSVTSIKWDTDFTQTLGGFEVSSKVLYVITIIFPFQHRFSVQVSDNVCTR